MAKHKTITGVRSAFVTVGEGRDAQQVVLHHGDPLPDGVTTEEIDRLDELGVFSATPRHLLPFDQRPPLTTVPGTATLVPAGAPDDRAALESENAQLRAQLAEATKAPPAVPASVEEAVAGSAKDVAAYADAHPDQVQALLDAEQATDRPRSTVVEALQRLTPQE